MLISILYVLLYIAVAVLIAYFIIYAIEQISGKEVPPRIKQLLWIIILLICVIALVEILPLPALGPWPRRIG